MTILYGLLADYCLFDFWADAREAIPDAFGVWISSLGIDRFLELFIRLFVLSWPWSFIEDFRSIKYL